MGKEAMMMTTALCHTPSNSRLLYPPSKVYRPLFRSVLLSPHTHTLLS